MEENDDITPFWLQNTDNSRYRRRSQPSSLFSCTGILIILLTVIAFAFIFVIIPSFYSFTSQIFKPHLVKKSWDSLNLVLVLFAIICGFLSKNNGGGDNDPRSSYEDYKLSETPKHVQRSNPSTPRQWYEYSMSDRTAYGSLQRLRSSSSYPDLRQEPSWTMNGDYGWRFYDDTHLYNFRSRSSKEEKQEEVYINTTKDIAVDTVQTPLPPPSPPQRAWSPPPPAVEAAISAPQSPPPQAPKVIRRKPKRRYEFEDVRPEEKSDHKELIHCSESKVKNYLPPALPARPPPSIPPPPPPPPPAEKRSNKSEKKRGGATKDFLISLRRKKKKQRQRSVENLEEFFKLSTLPLYPPASSPPPPPPPPPPLPAFYENIFSSKKSKARKNHSIPSPPALEALAHASLREPHKPPVTATQKPPLPVKISNIRNVDESVESGNESPLNPIPPPPPPPPFKMPAWKFEVHGDFVRLKSINSSRSATPYLDDPLSGETSPSDGNKTGEMAGDDLTVGPVFCPSPDVDTKADNFIARFRAGLKLEKMNSVRGRSNLGSDPGPSTVREENF